MRSPRRILPVVLVVLAAVCAPSAAAKSSFTPGVAKAVLEEVNRIRVEHGLRPVRRDRRLARASRVHVLDLLQRNAFEHGDVLGRLSRFGARGPIFGENLAWGPKGYGPRRIVRMWMDSPGHREILLRPGWRRVGVGVAFGRFSGQPRAKVVAAAFAGT